MLFTASCTYLSRSRLQAIRENLASRRPSPFVLSELDQPELSFTGEGFYCGLAMLWLMEKKEANLMVSEYDDLARQLGAGRTCVILTQAHRERYAALLEAKDHKPEELARDYNVQGDPKAGPTMLAAVQWFRKCLEGVDEDRVAVVTIG